MLQLVGEMARRAPRRVGHLAGQFRRSQAHGREFLWREMGLDPSRLHYSPSVVDPLASTRRRPWACWARR